jgi:hypothetical protein
VRTVATRNRIKASEENIVISSMLVSIGHEGCKISRPCCPSSFKPCDEACAWETTNTSLSIRYDDYGGRLVPAKGMV